MQRIIGGVRIDEIDAFADVPGDQQVMLVTLARLQKLSADEEISGFSVVLVLRGAVNVCATILDAAADRPIAPALVVGMGSMEEGIGTRVVSTREDTEVAVWDPGTVEVALKSCPWVVDELRDLGDRFQALVGATMGPLSDLDDATRLETLGRLSLRVLSAGEVVHEKGQGSCGVAILGGGSLLVGDEELGAGDFLFPQAAFDGRPAPDTVVTGQSGALLLVGDRKIAQELFALFPSLIELFSSA